MSNSERLRDVILMIVDSQASKTSLAAAAQSAQDVPAGTSQEMARLIEKGQASKTEMITSPAGAEVYIDGNKAGATPLELVLIKRDNTLAPTIKLPGYKTVEKTLVVSRVCVHLAIRRLFAHLP
jgi:PEGA domain-containing protein